MGRDAERGVRSRLSSALGTLCLLAVLGFGVYGLATSGYQLWVQHSGIPAQLKLEHCKQAGRRSAGWAPKVCTAAWRQADGSARTVTVYGPHVAYGQIVDVHIRGDEAYTNGPWPWRFFVVSILLVGIMLGLFVLSRRRKRAPPEEAYWP
jgi:hypothetical protein